MKKETVDFGEIYSKARTRMLETLIGKSLLKKFEKYPDAIKLLAEQQPSPMSSIRQHKITVEYKVKPESADSQTFHLEILETLITQNDQLVQFILSGKNKETGRVYETVKKA